MKKAIATLICLLVMSGMIAHAQHMAFKNVPIDGTLNEFTEKLINQGFKYKKAYETEHEGKSYKHMDLYGDFAGFKNCNITVDAHKKPDLVYRVYVEIKTGDWDELLLDYESLSTALHKKYPITALTDMKTGPNSDDLYSDEDLYSLGYSKSQIESYKLHAKNGKQFADEYLKEYAPERIPYAELRRMQEISKPYMRDVGFEGFGESKYDMRVQSPSDLENLKKIRAQEGLTDVKIVRPNSHDERIVHPNSHDERSVKYSLSVNSSSFWNCGVVELHLKEVDTKTGKIAKLYIEYEDCENKFHPVNKVDERDL